MVKNSILEKKKEEATRPDIFLTLTQVSLEVNLLTASVTVQSSPHSRLSMQPLGCLWWYYNWDTHTHTYIYGLPILLFFPWLYYKKSAV